MVIQILVGVGPEGIVMVVTAVAIGLQVEIEVDHRMGVVRENMLQAPEQQRVGIKGVEGTDRRLEIGKDGDREDNNDDDIRSTEDLPRMFAVQLQNPVAELRNVFRAAVPVEIEIVEKGPLIEAFEDFIGEIVVADGQPMPDNVLDGVDTEISIDTL